MRVRNAIVYHSAKAGKRIEPAFLQRRGRPQPELRPLLVALWIYGMGHGDRRGAAEIVRACSERDDFRWLRGSLDPSDQPLLNVLGKGEELTSIWIAVIQAMHQEGHIDLNVILEDGVVEIVGSSSGARSTSTRGPVRTP